jgi:putative ABC transport system permease protein
MGMRPWTLAWRSLRARPLRAGFTVLGVAVALLLVVMTSTVLAFTTELLEGELAKYEGQLFVRSRARAGIAGEEFPPLSSTLSEALGEELLATPGVDRDKSALVLFRPLAPPPFPSAPPEALAVGLAPEALPAYLGPDVFLTAGVKRFGSADADEVILGPLAHRFFGAPRVGDVIEIAGHPLTVVGLVDAPPARLRLVLPVAALPLRTAQAIFHQEGTISTVLLGGDVADSLRARHPELDVVTQSDMGRAFGAALDGQRYFFRVFQGVAYAIAGVMLVTVLGMAVGERRREIGMLRAIGARPGFVMAAVMTEALVLGVGGGMVALGAALLLDACLGLGLIRIAGAWALGSALLGALVTGAVAAVLPAWRAARIDPAEAMSRD